ncbi:response regulator [candidate division KSB1 bacterium]|nr:response regulator [candidate division KSB1 bacterium]
MKTKSILIVDDEKNIRLTLSSTLESIGIAAETAVNGEEAMEKVALKNYDMVLLDIKMPGMSGLQTLEKIKSLKPQISVIMITAHGTVENAVEAMKLGAVDYLQKPFTPNEIRELVTNVLGRQELEENKMMNYEDLIQMSKKYIEMVNFHKAEEYLRQAISKFPNRPEAFDLLGRIMEINHEIHEAQKFYRTALSLDPTYEPAQKNLSRTVNWDPKGKIVIE